MSQDLINHDAILLNDLTILIVHYQTVRSAWLVTLNQPPVAALDNPQSIASALQMMSDLQQQINELMDVRMKAYEDQRHDLQLLAGANLDLVPEEPELFDSNICNCWHDWGCWFCENYSE